MSLEVRQLILRARVQPDLDEDDDDGGAHAADTDCACGDEEADCEDKESLKAEILAACRQLVREELRALRDR